ncbi:response regulator transcription factor [Maribellus mangrovi]|uniref:response regulator transcription factor n=1 Tax=Maribellus mangrovi TaxID=3133146 RepID=UPI0030EF31AC
MKQILLIEDERIIADDLRINLEKDDFARVEISANFDEAQELFDSFVPSLIISDVQLNVEPDGIDIVAKLCRQRQVPVIYLTAYSDEETVHRIEQTLPFAYLLKPYNINQLRATVNLALQNFAGNNHLAIDEENLEKIDQLTTREKQVLAILATGKISKEIADNLNISINTVEQHKKNIKKKLNLSTVGELVNFAISARLEAE